MRADRYKASHIKKGGKDAGTTGKSPAELEKMIGMLKKVVERVQRENESLKRAPGVISNEVMDDVKKENAQLKVRLLGTSLCRLQCMHTAVIGKVSYSNSGMSRQRNRNPSLRVA